MQARYRFFFCLDSLSWLLGPDKFYSTIEVQVSCQQPLKKGFIPVRNIIKLRRWEMKATSHFLPLPSAIIFYLIYAH